MLLVDALSCLPSRINTEIKLDLWVDAISMFAFTPRHLTKIGAETQWDPILFMVHRLTWKGWPDRQGHVPRVARFYWSFHDELSIDSNLLTKGAWVVIPPSCRDNIMVDLHGSHADINKAMDLARTCIYWPSMEADVTDYIKQCLTCIKCSNLPVEMLQPHEVPPRPWVKIGVDFFQDHLGKKHLIVADYFSKFPYMFPVASTHHFKTITHLRELFAAEGIPAVVMSNNGPPFNEEFRQFACDFDFMHTTSSPHFHQSNGFIEAMVMKVKNAYKKTDGSPNAQARALLQLRDTPITADLPSPAEILHGHPAQGAVLSRPSKRVNICQITQTHRTPRKTEKNTFNKAHRATDLCTLKVKEQVQFFHNKLGTGLIKWMTGTVTEILECGQSYMIQAPNGRVYRRNRAHLKPMSWWLLLSRPSSEKKETAQRQFLSRPSAQQGQIHLLSEGNQLYGHQVHVVWWTRHTSNTPTPPPLSPPRCYSPRSPSCSPSASFPSRESSVEPSSEDSSPEGRKRHQSEPAFIQPRDID